MKNTKPSRGRRRGILWASSLGFTTALALCFSGCGGAALAAYELEVKKKKKTGQQVVPDAPPGPRQARLRWTPPTHRMNGEPLGSDLAGYKLYRGPRSRYYDTVVDLAGPLTTEHLVEDLAPGTYYFAVSAYDVRGSESGYSNEASKTIR